MRAPCSPHRKRPSQETHGSGLESVHRAMSVSKENVEISVKGKWFHVPALNVNGKRIDRKGNWLKIAHVKAEEWLETPVEDPALCVKALKEQKSGDFRADIFTFCQKLPAIQPQYSYP